MDFLSDINCPQYVNFNSVPLEDNSMPKGLDVSPSTSSVKDCSDMENMDTEGEKSYYSEDNSEQSNCENMQQSTFSVSYFGNSGLQDSFKSVSPSSYQAENFPVNHAKNLSLPEKRPKRNLKAKTTKVEPFHFAESKKRKRETEENEHIPLAEQVAAFHKKTPQRFHTTGQKAFEPQEHWSPEIVIPKSPNLRARKRMRPIDVLSREEQEQLEAEEMKKYKFRARPLNKNILNRPHSPHIRKKTPTKAHSMKLRTAQRAVELHGKKKTEEKPFEFHARPVPKAILSGTVGLKEKVSLPVTEAKTPNFALKSRAEKWKNDSKLNETIQGTQLFKANPIRAPSSPFVVKHEKKRTEIQPFSFDSKDKERMRKKEKKIQEEIEKENAVFVFKAQLLPSPTPSALPPVPKKLPTRPQPFSFHSEERSSRHNSFNCSLDQTCPTFKAQPATVLEKPPFVPEKPPKQPLEVKAFHLHTDVRAVERQKLKEINDIKEREKELELQRLRELQEQEEFLQIQKLRKEIVHKANPIRHYKPVEIQPSSKPPTTPVSPKFKTDERLQSRH